jgi:uncharacterized protein YggU (UPF0235/DUF167 family)
MPQAVDVRVRLTPRARRPGIGPVRADGVLVVKVAEPPVDGRANDGLCRALARAAGVPRSAVTVVSGHAARDKRVRIATDDPAAVRAALGLV